MQWFNCPYIGEGIAALNGGGQYSSHDSRPQRRNRTVPNRLSCFLFELDTIYDFDSPEPQLHSWNRIISRIKGRRRWCTSQKKGRWKASKNTPPHYIMRNLDYEIMGFEWPPGPGLSRHFRCVWEVKIKCWTHKSALIRLRVSHAYLSVSFPS